MFKLSVYLFIFLDGKCTNLNNALFTKFMFSLLILQIRVTSLTNYNVSHKVQTNRHYLWLQHMMAALLYNVLKPLAMTTMM